MTDVTLDRATTILATLVAFDTESSRSNRPLIDWVAGFLRDAGVAPTIVPNAAGDKAALFATIGPMQDGGIVLSGHTDVVPVAGQAWTGDPFRLREEDGRLYGRGAVDMKGFLSLALAMVLEFGAAPLRRPVHFLFTYDEETTCLGPLDTIARFGVDLPRPALVIVGEPTGLGVADAHKSVSTYRTHVTGHAAHSARPDLGVNAIAVAAELIAALYGFARDLEQDADRSGRFTPAFSTTSVGMIAGGTARNILAQDCAFHWDFRGLPGVPAATMRNRLDAYVRDIVLPRYAGAAWAPTIDTLTEIEVPALRPDPGSPAESLALRLTRSNRTTAVPFATEAGRFQGAGLPTVVCGPGSIAQAHQPDEYISRADFAAGLAFLRALAGDLAA